MPGTTARGIRTSVCFKEKARLSAGSRVASMLSRICGSTDELPATRAVVESSDRQFGTGLIDRECTAGILCLIAARHGGGSDGVGQSGVVRQGDVVVDRASRLR